MQIQLQYLKIGKQSWHISTYKQKIFISKVHISAFMNQNKDGNQN